MNYLKLSIGWIFLCCAIGLRTDFRGELFGGSEYLLAWSDKLVELKTICFCGRKASMVLRLDQSGRPYNEGEQVVIGGNERYVSVCRKHYKQAQSEGSLTAIQEHDTATINLRASERL
jgi:thymidine kinase